MSEKEEIYFNKYEKRGAYHWEQCSNNIFKSNAFIKAVYSMVTNFIKILKLTKGGKILDIGCGDGALSGIIAKMGYEVYGVDVSTKGIEFAREMFKKNNLHGNFYTIEGYSYPFEDAFFDLVICVNVIEHVQKPISLLKEVYRVLKKNGCFIISTLIRFTEKPFDKYNVYEWFEEEFESFCREVFLEKPVTKVYFAPLIWYELYNISRPFLARFFKLFINFLAILGINVFMQQRVFKKHTMQMLVFKKN